MTASDAQTVADNFDALIANYSDALARKTLTENFHDYTDSVIELIDNGCPNGPLPVSLPSQLHKTRPLTNSSFSLLARRPHLRKPHRIRKRPRFPAGHRLPTAQPMAQLRDRHAPLDVTHEPH
jgi:hypothetical protein